MVSWHDQSKDQFQGRARPRLAIQGLIHGNWGNPWDPAVGAGRASHYVVIGFYFATVPNLPVIFLDLTTDKVYEYTAGIRPLVFG